MEQIKEFFLNWQALAAAFGSFILLGLIRQVGTRKNKAGKVTGGFAQSKWFNAFTPLYPYILAIGMVLLLPMPKVVVELGKKAFMAKILFGLYAGWLSGYSFQVIKKFLENAFGVKFDPELGVPDKKPDPPAPTPATPPPTPDK